ncbi:hypothetical protein PPSIR1_41189, partial [Plesiocystis pacifica SIR-1]
DATTLYASTGRKLGKRLEDIDEGGEGDFFGDDEGTEEDGLELERLLSV